MIAVAELILGSNDVLYQDPTEGFCFEALRGHLVLQMVHLETTTRKGKFCVKG